MFETWFWRIFRFPYVHWFFLFIRSIDNESNYDLQLRIVTTFTLLSFLSKSFCRQSLPKAASFIKIPNICFWVAWEHIQQMLFPRSDSITADISRFSTNCHLPDVVAQLPCFQPPIWSLNLFTSIQLAIYFALKINRYHSYRASFTSPYSAVLSLFWTTLLEALLSYRSRYFWFIFENSTDLGSATFKHISQLPEGFYYPSLLVPLSSSK